MFDIVSLNILPVEILELIAKDLDKPDQARLSRCSRCLYASLAGFVYHDVPVTWNRGLGGADVRDFVNTLVQKPVLATYPRCIKYLPHPLIRSKRRRGRKGKVFARLTGAISFNTEDDVHGREDRFGDIQFDFSLIQEKVNQASGSKTEATRWMEDLQDFDDPDPWFGLLITLLPNIRTLIVGLGRPTTYLPWVLRRVAYDGLKSLHALADVQVECSDEVEVSISDIMPVFDMRSMREVYCCQLSDRGKSTNYNNSPSSVTSLRFGGSVRLDTLRNMIQRCSDLQRFEFKGRTPPQERGQFRAQDLMRALDCAQESVQDLFLSGIQGVYQESDLIEAVTKYTALRHLLVEPVHLLRQRRSKTAPNPDFSTFFPDSIQRVDIVNISYRGEFQRLVSGFQAHVLNTLHRTPHLKTLFLAGNFGICSIIYNAGISMEDVIRRFMELGVCLGFVDDPTGETLPDFDSGSMNPKPLCRVSVLERDGTDDYDSD